MNTQLSTKISPLLSTFIISSLLIALSSIVAYKIGQIQGHENISQTIRQETHKLTNIITEIQAQPKFHTIDKDYLATDVKRLISIQSSADIIQKRKKLIHFLWGSSDLPTHLLPSLVNKKFYDKRYKSFYDSHELLKRIDLIRVKMDFDLESNIYHFIPQKTNNKLVLFHQGHKGDIIDSHKFIKKLLAKGYSVAGFSMPLFGINNQPDIDIPHLGQIKLTNHDQMKFLSPQKGHRLKYFFEPVLCFLNHISSHDQYKNISMVGISGGGWTTTLYAAIDERIQHSFPVAGSYPIYLRSNAPGDWGDYEQTLPELYQMCNYLELYIMGSFGKGRSQLQMINQYDKKCFFGIKWQTYYPHLKQLSQNIKHADWDLYMDESHTGHIISLASQNKILSILDRL